MTGPSRQVSPGWSRPTRLLEPTAKVLSFAAFFLIPFLGGNHLALPYLTIDRFWIETSFLFILIASIAVSFLHGDRPRSGLQAFLMHFSPLFVVSALSLIYTWSTYNTAKELNTLLWIFGAVYLYSLKPDKQLPLRALVWGSTAVVICAVLQLKVLFPQLSAVFTSGWHASMLQEKSVPFVAFLNENMFGGYLLLTLPISISLGLHEKIRSYFFTTPLIIVGILVSLSRLSLVVMVIELSVACVALGLLHDWHRPVALCVTAATSAALFFLTIYIQGSPIENNIAYSFEGKTSTALAQAKTLNLRTSIWQGGARAFQERPALGYGAGAFEYAFRRHFGGRLYTRYSHGGIVKIAVELGLMGVVAYLWYLFGLVRGLRAVRLRPPFLLLAVTGGFLFSLVDCALDTAAFVVTFFVISSTFLVRPRRPIHIEGKPLFVSTIVLLFIAFAFTGRANLARKTVEEGVFFEEMGNMQAAIDSYEQALITMPIDNEPRIRLIAVLSKPVSSDHRYAIGQKLADAINSEWNQTSLGRDKDSELLFTNALGYWVLNKRTQAYLYINKAMQLYPSSPYYVAQAVDWYLLDGDLDKADSLIRGFEPFIQNIRAWSNPYGLYIYELRELSADIELKKGNIDKAVRLAENNLRSAQRDEFVITSYKGREFVRKEWLVQHLVGKLNSYRSQAPGAGNQ
jgi:tetratricopeptide (TPR) repeat protein